MKRVAIISPSGKLYGSEQVLGDFLSTTEQIYDVYVFADGGFCKRLTENKRHRIYPWLNVKLLYVKLFIALLFNKYDAVFCNEAGHFRYIYTLALLLPKKHFSICFRILEDCSRLQFLRRQGLNNIKIITVSEYMAAAIRANGYSAETIMDSYKMSAKYQFQIKKITKVGVIGRVTASKGLPELEQLLAYIKSHNIYIEVLIFGTVEDENFKNRVLQNYGKIVKFMGFVADQKEIYNSIDAVWHFNCYESLGRVFFEALDYGKIFVGFDSGGIGESGRLLGLNSCLVKKNSNCWEKEFLEQTFAAGNIIGCFQQAADKIEILLSPQRYVKEMETAMHHA